MEQWAGMKVYECVLFSGLSVEMSQSVISLMTLHVMLGITSRYMMGGVTHPVKHVTCFIMWIIFLAYFPLLVSQVW